MTEFRPVRRLLFLLPFAPRLDGLHGGSRTIAQFLAVLGEHHRIAVLYMRGPGEPAIDDGLRVRCDFVEEIGRGSGGRLYGHRLQRLKGALALIGGTPPWVAAWKVPSFEARARAIAAEWRPDIVQIEFHVMGQYASALRHSIAPRILVQHDPGMKAAQDRRALRRGLARLLSDLEIGAWSRYERAVMRDVRAVVVFTEGDRRALEMLAGETAIVRIPVGTGIPEQALDPVGLSPPRLVFVGSFIHPPNTDAAFRLVRDIFPRLRREFPEVSLDVVGDDPPASIRRMAAEDVHVTGRVPDVRPYLDRAAIAVVPLRLGGGMRVKVLEALANGKAIVASRLAVEGLSVVDGEHALLAETDEQFCAAIARLLRDPEERAALARRARAWACANLGWEKVVASYEALYASLIGDMRSSDLPAEASRGTAL